jgi:hypothetical protein
MQPLRKRYRMDKAAKKEYKTFLRIVLGHQVEQRKAEILQQGIRPSLIPRIKTLVGFNGQNEVIGKLEFTHGNGRRYNIDDFFTKRQAKKELQGNGAVSFVVA